MTPDYPSLRRRMVETQLAARGIRHPGVLRVMGVVPRELFVPEADAPDAYEDAARPILNWRLDYFTVWPHVKNLIPHQSMYNFGRMQEVWLDK